MVVVGGSWWGVEGEILDFEVDVVVVGADWGRCVGPRCRWCWIMRGLRRKEKGEKFLMVWVTYCAPCGG